MQGRPWIWGAVWLQLQMRHLVGIHCSLPRSCVEHGGPHGGAGRSAWREHPGGFCLLPARCQACC